MPSKKLLTQERLREVLQYSPTTGFFTWKISVSHIKVGAVARCHSNEDYVVIGIDSKRYRAHRLAFLYMEGYFPEYDVDHINGVRDDNRWTNLRHASRSCNNQNCKLQKNSTSSFVGVSWYKTRGNWCAYIKIHKKRVHIGYYITAEEAALARCHYENQCPDWTCNHLAVNRVKLRSLGYEI